MNNISDTKKPCPSTNLNKVYLCPKGLTTMHTIASPEPEPQDPSPKLFRKDNMQADLQATASKFDEMANLFSVIKTLLDQKSPHAASQVKQLAETGMYVCEDWSDQIMTIEQKITTNSNVYFH